MMFWRAAHEMRGTRQLWFTDTSLNEVAMSQLAAKAIYRVFNLLPALGSAANDRDHLWW